MRRTWYRLAFLLCTVLAGFSLLPGAIEAQTATPVPVRNDYPPDFCTETEILDGDIRIEESPVGAALIGPASSPDMDLYVVKVILPPGTCVSYAGHYLHDGAAIWLVDSGKVEFDFRPIAGWPTPNLTLERNNGDQEPVTARMVVKRGDWVAADSAVDYSYRNIGGGNAVIIMAVHEKRVTVAETQFDPIITIAGGCKGVCRRR